MMNFPEDVMAQWADMAVVQRLDQEDFPMGHQVLIGRFVLIFRISFIFRLPKYLELSRLPNDLLRPAAVEDFLRPSIPFSVSAVKVVFNPQGLFYFLYVLLIYFRNSYAHID